MIHRPEQLSAAITEITGTYLVRERPFPRDVFVSIARVDVTPDCRSAVIFIDVFPDGKRGTALRILPRLLGGVRKELADHLAFRRLPQLRFELHTTADPAREAP